MYTQHTYKQFLFEQKKALDGDKTQSIILLKEALDLIHDYLKEIKQDSGEELHLDDKDTIKVQKYLTYVLEQVRTRGFLILNQMLKVFYFQKALNF